MFTRLWSSLQVRILAVALAPALAFAAIAAFQIWTQAAARTDLGHIEQLVELSEKIGAFVHEAQRERGASSGFVASKGAELGAQLLAQRAKTDDRRGVLTDALKRLPKDGLAAGVAEQTTKLAQALAQLDAHRASVDALTITTAQNLSNYTGLIETALGVVRAAGDAANNAGIARRVSTYVSFLSLKEYAGRERASGAAAFSSGQLDLAAYRRLASLDALQKTYEGVFRQQATPAEQAALDSVAATEPAIETARLRKLLLEATPGAPLVYRDAAGWFRASSARIDQLKKIEDDLSVFLAAKARAERQAADQNVIVWSVAAIAALLVSGGFAYALGAGVARPLARVAEALVSIGRDETPPALPQRGAREVLAIASSAALFRDSLAESRRMREEADLAAASGAVARRDAMIELADSFERAIGGIVGLVSTSSTELQATAYAMQSTAASTADQSGAVAAAASDAASNVTVVAAAAEELTASISEISRQVSGSAALAHAVDSEARQTAALVQDLSAAAVKIGDVVQLISTIAAQTNLLALNATIEAARAGEAGRGFAVVAAEVKELASQTSRATEQIAGQVEQIQGFTRDAVTAIGSVSTRVQDISGMATAISAAVSQQGAATQEIARSVSQAADGTSTVTNSISGVAQAAEETGVSAGQVLDAASELSRQSENLNAEVGRFLSSVRAA